MSTESRIHALEEVTKELHARLGAVTETLATVAEAVNRFTESLAEAANSVDALREQLEAQITSHAELTDELRGALNGYEEPEDGVPEDETEEQRATRVGVLTRLSEVESLVRGRNRSAPTKRNMTDADAERVLVGDVAELGHKEAGEQVGLTYAQVYSCRLEYTFKHVHKRLRDGGWKNPFVK